MTQEHDVAMHEDTTPPIWNNEPVWRSTRALVVCGVLAATLFVTNLVLGAALVYATGIPGLSATVSGLFVPLLLSLSSLVTRRAGACTAVWMVYSILAIPTVLNGPPGIYKVAIGLAAGLAYDLPICLSRGQQIGHYVGLFLYTIVNLGVFWIAFDILDLPGAEVFRKAVFVVAAIFFVEGTIGVTVANIWYRRRLSQIPFVQRLQSI